MRSTNTAEFDQVKQKKRSHHFCSIRLYWFLYRIYATYRMDFDTTSSHTGFRGFFENFLLQFLLCSSL